MLNTVRKGNRTQRKAKKFYECLGYQVEVVRRDKWRKDQDFFGLWDFICVCRYTVLFVQVKTNAKPTKKWLEEAREWVCPIGTRKEYVVYEDYQRGIAPAKRVVLR